jgi:hypothetical protein
VLEILPIVVEVAAINKFHIIHMSLNIPLLDLLPKPHSNIMILAMEIFHREANPNFKSLKPLLFIIKETIPRMGSSNQLCIIRAISSNISIIKSGRLLIIRLLSNNSNLIGHN